MKELQITNKEENQRLDKYLKKLLPNATSSFLYKMMRKKNITLNDKKVSGSESLKNGDRIKIFFSDETYDKFAGSPSDNDGILDSYKNLPMKGIEIVYEDEDILVASKPANMLSQKAKADDVSVNEYLLGYLIRKNEVTAESFKLFHPSIVNRLDRNTTGLIMMGKSLKGSQDLSRLLKDRTAKKFYLAAVTGHVKDTKRLDGYLIKDSASNMVKVVKEKTLEEAVRIITEYKPISYNEDENITLLKVHLITGKSHQIRAHLSSIGHPIIGDYKYGIEKVNYYFKKNYGVSHQLLHAYEVILPDGKSFRCKPPKEFSKIGMSI